MSLRTATVLLWLFVINLGVAFGAGLYEARIALPRWIVSSAESETHWNAEAARAARDPSGRVGRGTEGIFAHVPASFRDVELCEVPPRTRMVGVSLG
jgi:hypothetical protein